METPRAFISKLISSLKQPTSTTQDATSNVAPTENPLTALRVKPGVETPVEIDEARNNLLTLHVLFPNELLPALDLLDRKLVTRFIIREKELGTESAAQSNQPPHAKPLPAPVAKATTSSTSPRSKAPIYHVQSAQTPSPHTYHRHRHPPPPPKYYTIHLRSWHCTCPAFTFSLFPRGPLSHPPPRRLSRPKRTSRNPPILRPPHPLLSKALIAANPWILTTPRHFTHKYRALARRRREKRDKRWKGISPEERSRVEEEKREMREREWWGGVMRGTRGGAPVCKHLLACALVERGGVFAGGVVEKVVSREEAVGWAAGWGA